MGVPPDHPLKKMAFPYHPTLRVPPDETSINFDTLLVAVAIALKSYNCLNLADIYNVYIMIYNDIESIRSKLVTGVGVISFHLQLVYKAITAITAITVADLSPLFLRAEPSPFQSVKVAWLSISLPLWGIYCMMWKCVPSGELTVCNWKWP